MTFNNRKYFKSKAGYWVATTKPNTKLHRDVYAHTHGTIAPKMQIHHIDWDKDNNRIDNLQCLTAAEHTAHHCKHTNRWVGSEANKTQAREMATSAETQAKRKAWFKDTPEGQAHAKNRADSLRNLPTYSYVCEGCGKSYESYRTTKTKYCTQNCGAKTRQRIKRAEHKRMGTV